MRKLLIFLIMSIFPVAAFCAQDSDIPKATDNHVLTLKDCYRLALKESEIIASDAEKIKEAEARFLEAFGTILPQISFSRSNVWRNSKRSPTYNKSFEQKFVFKQALFSGFKEFAAIAGGKFETRQRENEKLRAQQLLLVDVSDAFYLLMEEREDLKVLKTIKDAFLNRISELKDRVDLGRSRTSEVVSTETQLYSLEDQIESATNQEQVALELLEFLVGRPVNDITDAEIIPSLSPEAEYLAKASTRADVLAANFAWKVDEKGIAIAKSGFLPQVNLEGDYYAHRSSAPTDGRFDTLLTVNVPIFEGTTTYGQVKEATARARESELLFKRAERLAAQDIHDAYLNARSDLSRTVILDKALKSAEKNYSLQLEDYKLNVVNNLDVLTAIQDLEDVRRSFIHISYESKRFYWQLLAAAGEINPE
ncbi:MAG: TolC family protein [Candidatus Omnitrophica bacterium]|nr:TolC family protein [Candidatus Omnitrophota bacterium]